MSFDLAKVALPDFGTPAESVKVPHEIYDARCAKLYEESGTDWVVVWGDREHFANLHYLSNFDPRFEEAVLVLGPNDARYLIVGNEGYMYRGIIRGTTTPILSQVFSLMGQKRGQSEQLPQIFANLGMDTARSIGIVGWKYVTPAESTGELDVFVPVYLLNCIRSTTPNAQLIDVTAVMTNPESGLRAYNDADNIALLEWGAARASMAVNRLVSASAPGRNELDVVPAMAYAGEPLSAHIMYATGPELLPLRSPESRVMQLDDAVFIAVGYWGGLTCRAGVLAESNPEFVTDLAAPYFAAVAQWYESVMVGAVTGDVFAAVTEKLAVSDFQPALNPGHLTSADEWVHTDFVDGGTVTLKSGMALQCDIIPEPLPVGVSLNCEDGVVLADADLRAQLAEKHPDTWERIAKRQEFMRNSLGINLDDSVLPLSNTPAYYAPLFMAPDQVFVRKD